MENISSAGVLPRDVLSVIFSFLGPLDLARISRVCSLWNQITTASEVKIELSEKFLIFYSIK